MYAKNWADKQKKKLSREPISQPRMFNYRQYKRSGKYLDFVTLHYLINGKNVWECIPKVQQISKKVIERTYYGY